MRRWAIVAATVLMTGACTIQPGGLTGSTGDEGQIRKQVDVFVETIFGGRGGEAYELMSNRCRAKDPKSTYVRNSKLIHQNLVGDEVEPQDVKISVESDRARVTYTLDIPQISDAKQRWIKESGEWHLDSCLF
ncbi:hypothetical protein [Aeromicrobium terrae]|jgi:hypothetical protein|uniref:DUF4878 domain-containing protein n=1 Tax=Aeromicrobium terrae TaxID=2498846 RepID=A0A5C8NNY8_9ACTN|nr:hypothetical protein [Aeromicrobium terrae]TXL62928.1 hypothetical protein FHP06_01430 [Aeromicrobium terrae]